MVALPRYPQAVRGPGRCGALCSLFLVLLLAGGCSQGTLARSGADRTEKYTSEAEHRTVGLYGGKSEAEHRTVGLDGGNSEAGNRTVGLDDEEHLDSGTQLEAGNRTVGLDNGDAWLEAQIRDIYEMAMTAEQLTAAVLELQAIANRDQGRVTGAEQKAGELQQQVNDLMLALTELKVKVDAKRDEGRIVDTRVINKP